MHNIALHSTVAEKRVFAPEAHKIKCTQSDNTRMDFANSHTLTQQLAKTIHLLKVSFKIELNLTINSNFIDFPLLLEMLPSV